MSRPVELTAECLAELSSRGPRYTSYPPATEFGAVSQDRVMRELRTVGADGAPISLYVHVPFCRSLCAYCGCNVIPTRDFSRGEAYVDVLTTELAIVTEAIGSGFPLGEVALGGGSPNFLSPRSLRTLMAAITRCFTINRDTRLSVELDPRDTTWAQIDTLAMCGFRSLSVGVQDFSDAVQDAIRRHQSIEQTASLVSRARAAGFDDLNVDIVYGLPHQHEDTFTATLDAVIGLGPDRIALFGYAHLPDRLPHQRLVERAGRVLDGYERATLLLLAIDKLAAAGYVHLGLDHFAKPGSALARAAAGRRMTRTFQGYVERRADTIIGVGTSAISSTPRMYWQNFTDVARWEAEISKTHLPVDRGMALDADDQLRRVVIDRLMCDGEVDLGAIAEQAGIDLAGYFARELEDLGRDDTLATYDPSTRTVKTTPIGKLLVRNVCMVFDRYQPGRAAGARFSPTI
jgi:oxygen-independent coproporphyrinogen-3 oxidase